MPAEEPSMRARLWLALLSVAVAACAIAAVPRPAHAGGCARPRALVIGVVPSSSDTIPAGEGVLVEITSASQRSLGAPGEIELGVIDAGSYGIGARLVRGGQRPISLRTEIVGPGFARYVPTRTPAAGTWQIVSRSGERVELTFGDAPAPPIGAAPELVRVERHEAASRGPASGSSSTWVTAVTRAPISAPWVGVLTYGDPRAGGEPILARALPGGEAQLFLYTSPGRCSGIALGQSPPGASHEVSIATFDLYGRVSPRSNVVQVTRAAP